jgi:hypothetical protein
MDEPFDLPVLYKGQEIAFPARLLQLGYTHKFGIEVNGHEIFFEPDEEQHYRAVADTRLPEGKSIADNELLKAIADAIKAVVT